MRGLAACAVALFHFDVRDPLAADWYHRVIALGWLGVPVFFVISGYCIAHARYHDASLAFYGRRFLRIYPPLWGSILFVLIISLIRKHMFGINDFTVIPKTPHDILYSFLGLTTPASSVASMNWVYWSLPFELAFYLIVGLTVIRGSSIGIIAFSLLALGLRNWGYPFSGWYQFAIGISAYFLTVKETRAGLFVLAISCVQAYLAHVVPVTIAALATFVLIVFPPAVFSGQVLRPLRAVGTISYSLYLIHVPVGCYIAGVTFNHLFPHRVWPTIARDFSLLGICIAASALFYCAIEGPSHRLARRWFKGPVALKAPPPSLTTSSSSPCLQDSNL